MAKGQIRSNKEAKKPKKDAAANKPVSGLAPAPTVVTVVPDKGKKRVK